MKNLWKISSFSSFKFFDGSLKFDKQISSVVKTSFFHLRVLAKVKQFIYFKDFEKVIHAFVSTRLDYCNSLYMGINQSSLAHLQMVQNAATRLLSGVRKREHITPVLISLHWLPARFRIDFKVLLLVFKCLNGLAPEYLSNLLSIHNPVRSLRSSNQRQMFRGLGWNWEVIVLFPLLHRNSGTVYLFTLELLLRYMILRES